jgi:Rieske Fe-S protein
MDPLRRRVCRATGLIITSAVLPAAPGCGSQESFYNGGAATSVMTNDAVLVPIPNAQTYLCRDGGGLYAMSAYCTHAHCVLQFNAPMGSTPPGFQCNCHGSTFDYNGARPTPPAMAELAHYKVVVDSSGKVFIDPATIVDSSVRTAG